MNSTTVRAGYGIVLDISRHLYDTQLYQVFILNDFNRLGLKHDTLDTQLYQDTLCAMQQSQ